MTQNRGKFGLDKHICNGSLVLLPSPNVQPTMAAESKAQIEKVDTDQASKTPDAKKRGVIPDEYGNVDINAMTDDEKREMLSIDAQIMQEHKSEFDEQSFSDCNRLDFKSVIKECPCTKRALIIFKYFHQSDQVYTMLCYMRYLKLLS